MTDGIGVLLCSCLKNTKCDVIKQKELELAEKVYFKYQIQVHKYWTILDNFGIPVLFISGYSQHVLKKVNVTFSGNNSTPEMFQYSPILGRSSIWDLKYTFCGLASTGF